jgi:tetratricopeptide (TPR) repeat protein
VKKKYLYYHKLFVLILFTASILSGKEMLVQGQDSNDSVITADNLFSQAKLLSDSALFDSAVVLFRDASNLYLESWDWDNYIRCQLQIGDYLRTEGLYDSALFNIKVAEEWVNSGKVDNDEIFVETFYLKGLVLNNKGETDKAGFYFSKSLDKSKIIKYDSLTTLLDKSLGNIYLRNNNYQKALKFYQRALEIENSRKFVSNSHLASLYQNIAIAQAAMGNYDDAENYFEKSITIKERLLPEDDPKLGNVYLNYGRFLGMIGDQYKALDFLDRAERIFLNKFGSDYPVLAPLYFNIGSIYILLQDYENGLVYEQRALDLYSANLPPDSPILKELYVNIGVIYERLGQFSDAIEYYKKSLDGTSDPEIVVRSHRNLANCYKKSMELSLAEDNYNKSIRDSERNFGKGNLLTADSYLDYGIFCDEQGDYVKAERFLKKAYEIYRKELGEKHMDVSNVLTYLGTHYTYLKQYEKALAYFQDAIISLVKDFNNTSIYSNPSIVEIDVNANIITALAQKSDLFYAYYNDVTQNEKDLEASLNTARLAVNLNERMRASFKGEESKLNVMAGVVQVYSVSVIASLEMYKLTGKNEYLNDAFTFSEKGKASTLLSSVKENVALNIGDVPDDIRNQEIVLKNELVSYKDKINEESQKVTVDDNKLSFLNKVFFEKSREYDSLISYIEYNYPEYYLLKYNNSVISIDRIQSLLRSDESLIEFKIADSVLVCFCISKNAVQYSIEQLPAGFADSIAEIIEMIDKAPPSDRLKERLARFGILSNDIFKVLFNGIKIPDEINSLIIVPDDYLGYMPFEILLRQKPKEGLSDYGELDYLLNKYWISYSYSATLLFQEKRESRSNGKILAIAPVYDSIDEKIKNVSDNIKELTSNLESLEYTDDEVNEVTQVFEGDKLLGNNATEYNFKIAAPEYKILHLAMHTIIDDEHPLESKLVFSFGRDTIDDGLLNTYEIYNLKLNAQMAVLSACKTGFGKLSQGEGIMSLARGFIYAGVPGIVMTLWEIEDISTSKIMTLFYKNLKIGLRKDEALGKAKLFYLKSADKLHSHPYFWAAYVQIGDNSPIEDNYFYGWIAGGIVLLLLVIFLSIRLKRKNRAQV